MTEVSPTDTAVQKVMVGTDRSETADRAVRWAAALANRYEAELLLVQVMAPMETPGTERGMADATRGFIAEKELAGYAQELAGGNGLAKVVFDDDLAGALLRVAAENEVDTLVVGNVGMSQRKEFLLGNVPNRISHNARCNVIIVNTFSQDGHGEPSGRNKASPGAQSVEAEPRLMGRATHIAAVLARHGIGDLFNRSDGHDTQQIQAQRLRSALEELGPTFAKVGQILSTRPDLLPPAFIEELSKLQDNVAPLTESQVVAVMEEELGVPWEDVFAGIESTPLAAGTIAQVHRATLEDGDRVVVKVQRPTARNEIMEDLALLELFAEKTENRPLFRQIIDMPALFAHLSDSLQRELDFRQEASNVSRMGEILEPYPRLRVPRVYDDLTTTRLFVMEEIQGTAVRDAPEGLARKETARQLLEAYYRQVLTDGFFHADPHPGNLMWWNDAIYFLDFGMIGEIGPDLRENMMLLLMAFWQEDVSFLMDVTLMLSGGTDQSDLDVDRFREELGLLMTKYRNVSLRDIQLGPILQEMTEISIRHRVPLPASLTLTAKAMAQMQQTAADLDPELDPFEVAGSFLMRAMTARIKEKIDPKWLFYESQKLGVRVTRLVEAFERLTGARPGPKLQVNFRAERLETIVHHAVRRLSLGATASAALLGASRLASAGKAGQPLPLALGALGGALALRLLIDLIRSDD
jgi:predicted unusual protein kinase regulating ubiquinone biosynthesis (AarF/ABC1/UbiB family)/nucleotide-binding universal stress UspA family protein